MRMNRQLFFRVIPTLINRDRLLKTGAIKKGFMTEKKIGLIAGSGQFPRIFLEKAKMEGFKVFVIAHINETAPELENLADDILWLHLGQLKKLIQFFRKNGVNQAVMMGAIKKTRMFSDVRPDLKAITLLAQMRHTLDDGLLSAFAEMLKKEGIEIQPSTFLLPEILANEGVWTKRSPSKDEKADIAFGLRIAKEIGKLDIGQCVVVGKGSVLAVEAIEGTDEAISRGGKLGNGSAVAVKVIKPNQDERFDVPAVGERTIEVMEKSGVKTLAVLAGKTIVFDKEKMIERADASGICIIGISELEEPQ